MADQNNDLLAAVDLGSNSFHMIIAREQNGSLFSLDKVKEMVRLNAGLDEAGNLTEEAQVRALACLSRFQQRLVGIDAERVRVAGTNTLRAAHNGEAFLLRAEAALGHPISVISGHEEARLVFLGAAFSLANRGLRRLVVDIGGGSTELIIGDGFKPLQLDSLYMGCVSMTRRFFTDQPITQAAYQRAKTAALQELRPIQRHYQDLGWEQCIGTSGSIKAIADLANVRDSSRLWISKADIEAVEDVLINQADSSLLKHITERRQPVFVGGLVVLSAVFDALNIERMEYADGALREGLLYDLISRFHEEDSRDQGMDQLLSRFQTDVEHADRVQNTALQILEQVAEQWQLTRPIFAKLLCWAARSHEIGMTIAYNQYHKHGAYIVQRADIDGFSRLIQRILAVLVHSHRQKFPTALFKRLPDAWREDAIKLAIIFRLSVTLNRNRQPETVPLPKLGLAEGRLLLTLDEAWRNGHPLTLSDLQSEAAYLVHSGYSLELHNS